MTKKLKSVLALTLALIMCLGLSTTAFAAETDNAVTSGIPENATRHEVQVTLMPEGETLEDGNVDGVVQPYIWGNPSMNLIYHHTADTASFYVSDKYFAYEINAIPLDGNPTSQTYTIALRMQNAGVIASMTDVANGQTYKLDWITIENNANYFFRVTNNTDYILVIDIVYYSWN